MSVSDEFVEYVLDQRSRWGGVTSRKMFGLIADDVAYLKVDDSNRKDFVEAGSSPFKPYPDKSMTMSYFEVPPDVLDDPEELVQWADRSLAIQKGKRRRAFHQNSSRHRSEGCGNTFSN